MDEEIHGMQPIPTESQPPYSSYSSGKKSRLTIILVAVIVVVMFVLAIIMINIGPIDKISQLYVGLSQSNSGYLDVTVLVGGGSSLAGNGELQITFNDDVIYTSKISIDNDGTGELGLPYNSFIEGNGAYYFQVKYKGKESPPATYVIQYLVESLITEAEVGVVSDTGQLNITTFMLTRDGRSMGSDPKDAEYLVTEIRNLDDNLEIPVSDTPSDIDGSFIREGYSYFRSGNYSISVKVTNTRAKPTSDYYEINETRQIFLNILPIARGIATTTQDASLTYTANFDANASWNDGDITLYIWDFNNDGNVDLETKEPYASYSSYINGMNYDAVLNVQGDVILDTIFNDVEKGAVRIPVNSP